MTVTRGQSVAEAPQQARRDEGSRHMGPEDLEAETRQDAARAQRQTRGGEMDNKQ